MKGFSETQKQVIEDVTRTDFEKNKLQQKVRELENQLALAKGEITELGDSYRDLVSEKNQLMNQVHNNEQESFEI